MYPIPPSSYHPTAYEEHSQPYHVCAPEKRHRSSATLQIYGSNEKGQELLNWLGKFSLAGIRNTLCWHVNVHISNSFRKRPWNLYHLLLSQLSGRCLREAPISNREIVCLLRTVGNQSEVRCGDTSIDRTWLGGKKGGLGILYKGPAQVKVQRKKSGCHIPHSNSSA